MNFKIAFYIMMFFYGIDCIILTPYILINNLGEETGLVMSFGYNLIGLSFFYIWFVIFGIGLFFGLKYSFKYFNKRLGKLEIYPEIIMIVCVFIIMIWTIIHNLQFIN